MMSSKRSDRVETDSDTDGLFRKLVEQSVDGVVVVDGDGAVVFASSTAARMLRKPVDELLGYQLGYPAVGDEPVEMVIEPGGAEPAVVELRAAEISWSEQPAVLLNLRDVTVRRQAVEQLRDSESRFRSLFANSVDAIIVADAQGHYIDANPAACRMFGYSREQLLAMSAADLKVPEGEPDPVEEFREFTSIGERVGTFAFERSDGVDRVAEYSAFELEPGRFASVLRDVTERRSLEDQLRQSQKMEAVGRLAGGIAHDFNNLLTGIISFASFVEEDMPKSDPHREDIGEVLKAANRAAELTQQLLAFSRKQPIAPRVTNLNQLLASTRRLLSRTLGEDIEIIIDTHPELWPVYVDRTQLTQVIMNLAVNARDAMPGGGALVLTTENTRSSTGQPEVLLRVTDTGLGMSEEVRARIFEPFYSTKKPGKGTGLGLSMVYGLVHQAGGRIAVDSELGQGTTFELHLPKAHEPTMTQAPELESESELTDDRTILLVEDENLVRKATARILEAAGFTVMPANRGKRALELAADSAVPIDLVLTDVLMPGMNGREVAEALKKDRPELRVLFMTGYPDDAIEGRDGLGEDVQIISKPFTRHELVAKIRQVLS